MGLPLWEERKIISARRSVCSGKECHHTSDSAPHTLHGPHTAPRAAQTLVVQTSLSSSFAQILLACAKSSCANALAQIINMLRKAGSRQLLSIGR